MQNSFLKKLGAILIILLFVGASFIQLAPLVKSFSNSSCDLDEFHDKSDESFINAHIQELIFDEFYNIQWDAILNFTEPGGKYDYVVFGEAQDANDGPPHDDYDSPKPPAPMEPYVQAWFYDNMEPPYNKMFDDYRSYPDTNKVWNLTVMWADEYTIKDTTVNMSWNTSEFIGCEYNSITLYDIENNIEIDMLVNSLYEFTCQSYIKKYFTINCSSIINLPPNQPTIEGPNYGQPGAPYIFCINATDPNGDDVYCMWDWGDGTYTSWLGPYNSNITICKYHGWIETGIFEIKVKVKDEYELESDWSEPFIIIIEEELPHINIITPQKRTFYLNFKDRIIFQFPFLFTAIIGKTNIEVDASDGISGINKVEFYINGEMRYNDTTEPYNWTWNERRFFRHKITVIAYDNAGNYDSDEILVRKLF